MWSLSIALYFGLKWLTWWRARKSVLLSTNRSIAYFFAWPGMDAASFLNLTPHITRQDLRQWVWALTKSVLGVLCVWYVARLVPSSRPLVRGWIGMLGLILFLHFGSFEITALAWQRLGVDAQPIMSSPLRSASLSEFWGKRWNLGFRQLSYDLIFQPLHRSWGAATAGFLVFVMSGLIHDLVISVPARGGYGLPTAYFVLQGLGVATERSTFGRQLGLRAGLRGWLFMAVCTAGPVLLLFHRPFVLHVILPFMMAIHAL